MTKLMTKQNSLSVVEKGNGNKEETHLSLIKGVIDTISDAHNLPKLYQIGLLHQAGYNPKDIEIILNTSAKYASVCIAKIKKEPKTRQRLAELIAQMPDWFRTSRQAALPILAAAQNKAAQIYLERPELLIDKPQLAKQIAVQAGVKSEEESSPQFISIKSLTMIQNFLQQQQETAKQIEAEVIDISTEEK
jgi:hypothetical protein